jgi:hypothetical protein
LIAAQNPYAADDAQTDIFVSHQKWSRTISLKGKEVFLCKFDLTDIINSTQPFLSDAYVYPSVVSRELNVALTGVNGGTDVDFSLLNAKGQCVFQKRIKSVAGQTDQAITLPIMSSGIYFARFATSLKTITKKVVVLQ